LNNAGIYDFETHNFMVGLDSLNLVVPPQTTEVLYVRFATNDAKVTYLEEKVPNGEFCNMSLKESDEMIEKKTWERGQKSEVDSGCGIFEYSLQHKRGFGIGFENKSKKAYSMTVELELTNLAYQDKKGETSIEFELQPGAKHYCFLGIVNPGKQAKYEEGIGFEPL